jgi:hypothetical protein
MTVSDYLAEQYEFIGFYNKRQSVLVQSAHGRQTHFSIIKLVTENYPPITASVLEEVLPKKDFPTKICTLVIWLLNQPIIPYLTL